MNKDIEDSIILKSVLRALNVSVNDFFKKLDYSTHTSIYNVLNGKYAMSADMIQRIQSNYPQVSYLYLTRGKGEPIVNGSAYTTQRNMLNQREESVNPMELFLTMPEQIKYLVSTIDELKIQNSEILDKLEKLINNK